jgi:hypothetical protein
VDVTLGDLLADLATDVISSCLIGYNFDAQTSSHGEKEKGIEGILTCLREGVAIQPRFFGSGLSAFYGRISAWREMRRIKRYTNWGRLFNLMHKTVLNMTSAQGLLTQN